MNANQEAISEFRKNEHILPRSAGDSPANGDATMSKIGETIRDAETSGYLDRGRGFKRNDNPYPMGTALFKAWQTGWEECNDEYLADHEYSQD